MGTPMSFSFPPEAPRSPVRRSKLRGGVGVCLNPHRALQGVSEWIQEFRRAWALATDDWQTPLDEHEPNYNSRYDTGV